MYRWHLLIMIFFSCLINLQANNILSSEKKAPYNFTAEVKKGEGMHAFLRRFAVNNACNIDEFSRLNNFSKDQYLIAGREYKLPITIFDYDGKSIRSSIQVTEWDRAVKIKEYNEHIFSKGVRKTHYADSKLLWVPHHLLACFADDDVSVVKNRSDSANGKAVATMKEGDSVEPNEIMGGINSTYEIDPLYGKEYEKIEVVDNTLKDKVFYIVSGHGGPDPGAMCNECPSTLCEDEYAYDVALRLARNLRQHGGQVEMIIQDKNDGIRDNKFLKCDRDERCDNDKLPLNQKKRLNQRVRHINNLHAGYKKKGYKEHVVVVLHVDAAGQSARKDVFFYHHKNSNTGKKIATNIHKTFEKKYEKHQKGRGYKGTVKSRGLYMINYTHPPVVFIELANIKNPKDQQRILLSSNRQALANWLFEGLVR